MDEDDEADGKFNVQKSRRPFGLTFENEQTGDQNALSGSYLCRYSVKTRKEPGKL